MFPSVSNAVGLEDLLIRWEEMREQGRSPDLETFFQAAPEVAEEFKHRVDQLESWWHFELFASMSWAQTSVTTGEFPDSDEIRTRVVHNADLKAPPLSLLEKGDKYEVMGHLGSGGQGQVWAAMDRDLRREVAIKTVKNWGGFPRFMREAQINAQLNHPNILPIYEFGVMTAEGPSIAMPVVTGTTLKIYLAQLKGEERLGELPFLIDVLLKLCDAVGYIHDRGVCHCDVKPSNILLGGTHGEVYLSDFGLAARLDDENEVTSGVGTPHYMAPEQLSGESNVTVQTDIFGLGGVLYEILFNRPPNSGSTFAEIQRSSKLGDKRPFEAKDWPVPEALVRICRKAIHPDPGHRYPSAAAMAEEIRKARVAHMRGASTRVVFGLIVGVSILTMSTTGLLASLAGYLDIDWSFWAAFISCSLGLSIVTAMEATGWEISRSDRWPQTPNRWISHAVSLR